jgi:enamine deaminase RidA (YjgF/YER057c/UK114 family)
MATPTLAGKARAQRRFLAPLDERVDSKAGAETQAALEDLAKVARAAGFDLKDIVSVTVYLRILEISTR